MPQTVFAMSFTLPEINLLLDALNVYTDQEIDDPRNYTAEDLAQINHLQHASLTLLLRVKHEVARRADPHLRLHLTAHTCPRSEAECEPEVQV